MCPTSSASSQNGLWDQAASLPLYLYGRSKITYERCHLCCGEVIQSISVVSDQYPHGKDWLFSLSLGPKISVPKFQVYIYVCNCIHATHCSCHTLMEKGSCNVEYKWSIHTKKSQIRSGLWRLKRLHRENNGTVTNPPSCMSATGPWWPQEQQYGIRQMSPASL